MDIKKDFLIKLHSLKTIAYTEQVIPGGTRKKAHIVIPTHPMGFIKNIVQEEGDIKPVYAI